jgi:hypothetical protein
MDTWTIIIAAVLLAVALLPFIFSGKKYRKQKKQLVKALNGLAEKQNAGISQYEACDSFGIGIDKDTGYLFFARLVQDEIAPQTVFLSQINRCQLRTSSRLLDEGVKVIDRVELVLHPVSGTQPLVVFEVYNTEYDNLTIRNELLTAIRWEQIISGILKEIKNKARKQTSSRQVVTA